MKTHILSVYSSLTLVAILLQGISLLNALMVWMDVDMLQTILADKEEIHNLGEIPLSRAPVAMIFVADKHYGMQADEEWESLFGDNSGFIRLDAVSNPFELSLYHQLHCLNGLRKLLIHPGWEGDEEKEWHFRHCLNFLRQAILCNGDTTLEPSFQYELENGTSVPASHGTNVAQECRDWTAVRSFVENNGRSFRDIPYNLSLKQGSEQW
ncbi:hypothetical protein CPB84DRAFT_1962444 [Gymnopilus junonius]|uniref:Uncharacterized protein n=1 Tax=Gymnopilus junonius TaxID=109634 RepID=A0A9P5NPG6_GYMJU|nr:hypothetical protein CPB84DRAFT_1962444 [Gymnopilus junonius]